VYVGHYELELESIPVIEFRIEEPETFGEYIRKLRILKGWSQRELGRRVGLCFPTIIDYEKGRYIPQRKLVVRLLRALDADVWYAIQFDGVLTERQKDILKAFPSQKFTHGDCIELTGSRYLHDDLLYLVELGILDKQSKGRTGYYRNPSCDL
jgi:transcriptional regulator with XRE-family HTH domain